MGKLEELIWLFRKKRRSLKMIFVGSRLRKRSGIEGRLRRLRDDMYVRWRNVINVMVLKVHYSSI
jgi:hypothetical protein